MKKRFHFQQEGRNELSHQLYYIYYHRARYRIRKYDGLALWSISISRDTYLPTYLLAPRQPPPQTSSF